MTRLEENEKVINEVSEIAELLLHNPLGTPQHEETNVFHLGVICTILMDISKSLAIIADKTGSEEVCIKTMTADKTGSEEVCIKTMTDLPEHCYDCPCHDGESSYCQADKEHRYSFDRPFWCPLVKISDEKVRINNEAM